MPIAKCCKIDKREFEKGDNWFICMYKLVEMQIENQVKTMSVWEYLIN